MMVRMSQNPQMFLQMLCQLKLLTNGRSCWQYSEGWYAYVRQHMPSLIVLESWENIVDVLSPYEYDESRLDCLQRNVFVEFHQYLNFVGHSVASMASQAWNIPYD